MWNDNDKIMEIFNRVNEGRTKLPCKCPVCLKQSAHIYIHRHNNRHCGIWTWCSECGASSHMSGETPTWWKNPDFVDVCRLCSNPEYLNTMVNRIDEWANCLAPKNNDKDSTVFVVEDKFNVILKKDFHGISAGTAGILIIRDDFKAMRIDFVSADGKTTNIDESPEIVLETVEVVNPKGIVS